MASIDQIRNLIENNGTIDSETLDSMRAEYPYFIVPAILYLKQDNRQADNPARDKVLSSLALAYPEHAAFYDLVGDDAERFKNFYPPQEKMPTPDTDTTIDTFLNRYGKTDAKEIELLDRLIFNPMPDYSQILAEEKKDLPEASGNDPIAQVAHAFDSILAGAKQTAQAEEELPVEEEEQVKKPQVTDDSMLSESLAKIFIKQGKYNKALEIIKNISLKFPEKSIYFADQIRFLQKLILNEKINNR